MQTATPINLPKGIIRNSIKRTADEMKGDLKIAINSWIKKKRFKCNDFFQDQDRVMADDLIDFIKKL